MPETTIAYDMGYNAPLEATNPFPYPNKLSFDMMCLSAKEGSLDEDEKRQLKRLKEGFAKTTWHQWSEGHHKKVKEHDENQESGNRTG